MTDAAAALAPTEHLADFEGTPVLRTKVAITNAGDGLSDALAIEPQALAVGTTVYVVLECRVQSIAHKPTNKDDPTEGLARVHTLRAGRANLVDRADVEAGLAEQADRIRRAAEEVKGVVRLPESGELLDPEDEAGDPDGDPDPAAPTSLTGRKSRGRGRA